MPATEQHPGTFATLACLAYLAISITATAPLGAQGSREDYERADRIARERRGLVLGDRLSIAWTDDESAILFENPTAPAGERVRWLDTRSGEERAAYDRETLRIALATELGRDITDADLVVRRVAISTSGRPALLLATDPPRIARIEDAGVEIEELGAESPFAISLEPATRSRRRSRSGGDPTHLVLVNRSDAPLELVWIDTEGEERSYGTIDAGSTHEQPTYAGHVWRVRRPGDSPLGELTAPAGGGVVLLDGERAERSRADSRRARGPETARGPQPRSVERESSVARVNRGEVRFDEHNAQLRRPDGATLPLTSDGTAEDEYSGPVHVSPDGRYAVLYRVRRHPDREISIVESSPKDRVQPRLHTFRYNKPGDPLDVRRPRLFDLETATEIPIDESLAPDAWSILHPHWSADGARFFFVYNERGHRVVRVVSITAATGETRALVEERPETFFDYAHKLFVHHLESEDALIWMSERSGSNHLYLVDRQSGESRAITSGEWVVRAVDSVDEEARTLSLRVHGIHDGQDPCFTHFARATLDGALTVLTHSNGTHRIDPSPGGGFFVDTWSRVDQAPVHELRRSEDGALVRELARADASRLAALGPLPEPFVAKGRDGKTDIFGVIYRPSRFDATRRYPVIEAIYAGPHGQHVPKAFAESHGVEPLAELGFIVVRIDGMGTNWRSKAFHDVAWKNLKDAGFPDRIAWLRAAAARHPELDLERVGIYGGSAGGQNALRAVLDHHDVYRAAAADCGCHDNRMDKVWWNELWMSYPLDESYVASSNVTDAHRLGGALLLTVGELDRNVDPSSTMQVVDALIRADKDFELIVFPGAGHGAGGSAYGRRRMFDFFVRELWGVEPRWTGESEASPRRQQNRTTPRRART